MMARLFKGTNLILTDPLHPELKRLAGPMLELAVRRNNELRASVIARGRALVDAGYHEQVKVEDSFTGLFAYRAKSRQPLRPSELSTDLALSPNALLRPVVQDSIFPTVAYVGGAAETDYFAQAAAVYDALERPVPPVVPRISVTLLEARVSRAMKRYEISFSDVLRGREFLKQKAVEGIHGANLFEDLRHHLTDRLETLRPALESVDPTLIGALETSRQKIIHQVDSLRTRFVNAELRRNVALERHLDAIVSSLFPEKKLQERVLNVTSFLVRYGLGFIERLEAAVSLDSSDHQIVEI
jgi:uncharacterized protein YllA (UPF0747 family)